MGLTVGVEHQLYLDDLAGAQEQVLSVPVSYLSDIQVDFLVIAINCAIDQINDMCK